MPPERIESIFLAALFLPSAAAVLVFFMKYVSAVLQARARQGHDEAYREMALKVSVAQETAAAALSSFGLTLAEIQARIAVVERILKEVE